MDDGANARSGFYLHTKGFTFLEVYKLAGMLHYKFSLLCSVQEHENRPVIYIKSKSMNTFYSIVIPHIHPSMMSKFKI